MLEIDSTPFPARRVMASKYDEIFAQMQPGQCVKCDSSRVGVVSQAMRKWLEKTGKAEQLQVRTASKMPDGYGRVWMMSKKPVKMADLPSRKVRKLGLEDAA